MPASELLKIVGTVAVVQLGCDLFFYWYTFSQDSYQHAIDQLTRSKTKWEQIQAKETTIGSGTTTTTKTTKTQPIVKKSIRKQEQNQKKVQRFEDDYKMCLANLTRLHTIPNIVTSILFLILMRILGTELQGTIVAVLPFEAFSWLQTVTSRGLQFENDAIKSLSYISDVDGVEMTAKTAQVCSFTFVYILTNISIKYYVHQLFGYRPPAGAESITTILDTPLGQNGNIYIHEVWKRKWTAFSHKKFLHFFPFVCFFVFFFPRWTNPIFVSFSNSCLWH